MSVYVFLGLAFICNAAANIFLKFGALNGFSLSALLKGEFDVAHLYTGVAVVLFGANLAFYLLALRVIPLSVAYPIMVGMTFLITTGASMLLGESLSIVHLIGITMILAGILIILQFAHT